MKIVKVERRKLNRDLLEFLGPRLGGLWAENLQLFRAKKEAKLFRLCSQWRKFEHVC